MQEEEADLKAITCPRCNKKLPRKGRYCIYCRFDLSTLPGFFTSHILPDSFVLDRRYRIKDYVTSGGMAHVYRVIDTRLNKVYAMKEMMDNFRRPEERKRAVVRFKREAEILARLSHPSIPRVIDHFVENDRYYLVMDFIEAIDLETLLEKTPGGRILQEKVMEWLWQLIDVLRYLHSLDPPVVYRDLKPSNILVTKDGRIYLIDFGIARIFVPEKKGTLIGTPGYAPPEQYKGQVDARSDIYALGATLHHVLTGKDPRNDVPFTIPPVKTLLPGIDVALAKAIDGSLTYNVEDRIQTIDDFAELLTTSEKVSMARKHFNEGIALFKKNNFVHAIKSFTRSISLDPGNIWAYIHRGIARERLDRLDLAIDDFKTALKLEPENAQVHYNLGCVLKKQGNIDKAEESLRKAIKLDPGNYHAWNNLGNIYFLHQQWRKAIKMYERSLLANSSYQPAKENLERAIRSRNQNEASRKFDQKAKDQADPTRIYYNLGMYFLGWDKFDEAESEFKKALKIAPEDPEIFEGMGLLYEKQNQFDKAALFYSRALTLNPTRLRLYSDAARAYAGDGKLSTALELLIVGTEAVENTLPDWVKSPVFKEMALGMIDVLEQNQRNFPENKELRDALDKGEDVEEAWSDFRRALKEAAK